jgi:hypothetical protein
VGMGQDGVEVIQTLSRSQAAAALQEGCRQ